MLNSLLNVTNCFKDCSWDLINSNNKSIISNNDSHEFKNLLYTIKKGKILSSIDKLNPLTDEGVYLYDNFVWKVIYFEDNSLLTNYIDLQKDLINNSVVLSSIESTIYKNRIIEKLPYRENQDLFDIVNQCQLSTFNKNNIIKSLINGIYLLHLGGIAHRDIKPENILYNYNNNTIQLIDLVMSCYYNNNKSFNGGSKNYAAPELFVEQKESIADWRCVDIWSMAYTIYIILFKEYPWNNSYDCEHYQKYLNVSDKYDYWLNITQNEIYSLLFVKCFQINYKDRATIEDIHKLISEL